MKKIWILGLALLPLIASAQGGGKSKVMKEIEIAENILSSLLQQELEVSEDVVVVGLNGNFSNVEGTYIEDFGALFTIGGGIRYSSFSIGDNNFSSGYNYNLKGLAKIHERLPYAIYLDSDGKKRKTKKGDVKIAGDVIVEGDDVVIESGGNLDFFKKVSRDFFVDYGYLIKGIKPSEKVLIRYIQNNNNVAVVINGWTEDDGWSNVKKEDLDDQPGVYTAMVLKSDIDALQRGNLSEEQFEKKITYTEGEEDVAKETKDMKLINSIFSRLYKEDLSGSSCISSRSTPRSEYIPELGLVVNMRMNTRCRSGRFGGRFELFRGGQNGITLLDSDDDQDGEEEGEHEDERENPDEHYPEFLSTLKENVVEYGSIAKSLNEGEVLVFKINFHGCRDCKVIPENLSITAKQSTLAGYRQGKISLDKAIGELNIVD